MVTGTRWGRHLGINPLLDMFNQQGVGWHKEPSIEESTVPNTDTTIFTACRGTAAAINGVTPLLHGTLYGFHILKDAQISVFLHRPYVYQLRKQSNIQSMSQRVTIAGCRRVNVSRCFVAFFSIYASMHDSSIRPLS